jgi:hypothetical protein
MLHADLALGSYVSWRLPHRNLDVSIDLLALNALPMRALRFSHRDPSSEIGGLLWGKAHSEGDKRSIVISQVEFFPSERRLFNVTYGDFAHLSTAARRYRGDWEPLGYFRSNLRQDSFLGEQDLEFIQQVIVDPDSVVLVLTPAGEGVCSTDLFFWDGEELRRHPNFLELPLLAIESGGDPQPSLFGVWNGVPESSESRVSIDDSQHSEAGKDLRPADYILSEPPLWPGNQVSLRKSLWKAAPLLLAICVLVGIVAAWRAQHPKTAAEVFSPQLAIGVTRRPDGQYQLHWNRKLLPPSDSTQNGTVATLDGLSADGGRFQLQVIVDQKASAAAHKPDLANALVIPQTQTPKVGMEAPLSQAPAINRETRAAAGARTPGRQKPLGTGANHHSTNVGTKHHGRAAAVAKSPGQGDMESKGLPHVEDGLLAQPPVIVPAHEVEPGSGSQSAPVQDQASTAGSEERPVTSNPVSDHIPAETLMGKTAVQQAAPAQTADSIPPQPLKQVLPKLKRSEFSEDQSTVDIDIRVSVGADGLVTQAHPMGASAARNPLLTARAIATAKRWKFKPAEHMGKNVSGTYVINFQFRRPD